MSFKITGGAEIRNRWQWPPHTQMWHKRPTFCAKSTKRARPVHQSLLYVDRAPRERELYYKIRKDFYWQVLPVDSDETVRKWRHFSRNRLKLLENVIRHHIFPYKEPLSSVCIDILGPFIQTSQRIEYPLVITDRFSKIRKTIPLKSISAAEVAKHFDN